MPNLGYEVIGSSSRFGAADKSMSTELPSMPENGTLDSITIYLSGIRVTDREVKFAVWKDSDGTVVASTAAYSGSEIGTGAPQWVTISASGESLSSGVVYRVGLINQASVGNRYYDTGQTGYTWDQGPMTWPTVGTLATPDFSNSSERMSAYITYTAAGLTIDTIPTTINADSSFNVVVSNPATAPTTGNTTIKFTNASGQAATINSVTGTGPYTINATFPRASTDAFFASYALYVVVDAENATSGGTASYEPASGWSYVDVGTIDTSSEIYTQYSAGTIATGWQAVIKSPTNEDSVTVTMTDDLNYTFGPYAGSTNQTTEFYAINASQTVLAEETITFDFGAGSSSGVQLVKNIVQDIITDISSDMVG